MKLGVQGKTPIVILVDLADCRAAIAGDARVGNPVMSSKFGW